VIGAFVSLVTAAGGLGLYFLLLHFGIYRRYPVETYLLLGIAALLAWRAARGRGGFWLWSVAAIQGGFLVFFLGWTLVYSRIPLQELPVKPGDAMLDFVLPDQDGSSFSSAALRGKTAALYIFYRGDW